ncbi:hypothetical protein [Nonomuraea typhae]|uniref:Transporter n=1 Tax=Nonomuraea typhae TaxID=2603600 RepID=A0ABW7Z391_9ACTN
MVDDEAPASPEETLRLIERQHAATLRLLIPNPLLVYLPWGVAWLAGFGVLFLGAGVSGEGGPLPITWQTGLAVLWGSQLIAIVLMTMAIFRSGSMVRGSSGHRGAMYGITWMLAMIAVSVLGTRFVVQLPPEEIGPFYTGYYMLAVGILYAVGGAVFGEWAMFVLGAWILAVDVVGVALGGGLIYLLMAVLGGGGVIVTGLLLWWRRRR